MKRSSIALLFFLVPSGSAAQEAAQRDVTVQRIRPADLPKPEESQIPTVLGKVESMPRMPSQEDVLAMQKQVASRVVKVYVEVKPLSSLQRDPILMEGHAVWVSAREDGKEPILLTPAHWVDGAVRIKILPPQPLPLQDQLSAPQVSLKSQTFAAKAKLMDDPALVSASVRKLDLGRNLAVLDAPIDDLAPPDTGLKFFPITTVALNYLYGLSPYSNFRPMLAYIGAPDPKKDEALLYYLTVNFSSAPGAPVVAYNGELVAITAMLHPTREAESLVIPPLALQRFVKTAQGLDTPVLVEDVETP